MRILNQHTLHPFLSVAHQRPSAVNLNAFCSFTFNTRVFFVQFTGWRRMQHARRRASLLPSLIRCLVTSETPLNSCQDLPCAMCHVLCACVYQCVCHMRKILLRSLQLLLPSNPEQPLVHYSHKTEANANFLRHASSTQLVGQINSAQFAASLFFS